MVLAKQKNGAGLVNWVPAPRGHAGHCPLPGKRLKGPKCGAHPERVLAAVLPAGEAARSGGLVQWYNCDRLSNQPF